MIIEIGDTTYNVSQLPFPSTRMNSFNIQPHAQNGAAVAKKLEQEGGELLLGVWWKCEFLGRVLM